MVSLLLRDAGPRDDVGRQIVADAGPFGERNRAVADRETGGLQFAARRRIAHLGNADVDGEATRAVTIKDVGSTKVDVPDEVRKLLE